MKTKSVTYILIAFLGILFFLEIATHRMGDEIALLKMGALPTNGQLNNEYWRVLTYSFLHLNWQHFILNLVALWWLGRMVERRIGSLQLISLYSASVVISAIAILIWHQFHPSVGSAVGASGGIFGLAGAALILFYRRDAAGFTQSTRLKIGLWVFLFLGLAISFLPGVSFVGHISGLVIGLICGAVVKVKNISKTNI